MIRETFPLHRHPFINAVSGLKLLVGAPFQVDFIHRLLLAELS